MFSNNKKLICFSAIYLFIIILISCGAVLTPLPVGLYSNATFPIDYKNYNNLNEEYKILGTVEGHASVQSYLGLIAIGDASVYAAYKNAISQFPGADCLLNVTIDYKATSFLGIVSSFTTIIRGKAIQSNRNLRLTEIITEKTSKNTTSNLKKQPGIPQQNKATPNTTPPMMTPLGKMGKQNLPLDDSVDPSLSEFEARMIGEWYLESTKLPEGKLITPESGLKGQLSFDINKNVNLIFEQNARKIEFEGTYYTDETGAITIEVSQSAKPEPRQKIYYRDISLEDETLILKSESQKEYRWKKAK